MHVLTQKNKKHTLQGSIKQNRFKRKSRTLRRKFIYFVPTLIKKRFIDRIFP